MGFQDDWVMRQIEMLTRFVAEIVFGKNQSAVTYTLTGDISDTGTLTELDELHLELCRLIRESRFCDAEDMLFDNMQYSDKYIELASDFYSRLNVLSDAELDAGNFSRQEVYDGYLEIMTRLGVPLDVFGSGNRNDY